MKNPIYSALVFVLLLAPLLRASAEETSLEQELEGLNVPANEAPAVVAQEKLYSVQDRYAPLNKRLETNISLNQKISDTGFINTQEIGGGLRYYFNSKWSVGANANYVFNTMSSSAQKLYKEKGIIPAVPFIQYRAEATARYNLFYGKFRVSMDRVFYFDQYISVGPGIVGLSTGTGTAIVADIGLAFWLGHKWSARFGMKDYAFRENAASGNSLSNHVLLYVDVGYLFGSGGV